MSEYENMTLEELEDEIQRLMHERAALRDQQRMLRRAYDRKAARVSARHKVESFSDAEREALAEMIMPQGIVSEEAFGHPGLPSWLRRLLGQ